ncbi:mCG147549 [Mus musculus]|nr:mCG147549 [Mus musculus]
MCVYIYMCVCVCVCVCVCMRVCSCVHVDMYEATHGGQREHRCFGAGDASGF